ncbi:MAG TPA: F0F1 ATP synthase subunit B [Chthoniobacteraceae bacterium]|nr:F0F1 ATP synthase subunit B [Chthoniobacteraceae bacterium]
MIPLLLAQGGNIVTDTAEAFGFNTVLFVSQCVSFLVVAFLLYKFAYGPILKVLDERRTKIAESLANAEKIKQQLADAEAQHADILSKANQEAQKLIEEARASAAALAEKRHQEAIAEAEAIAAKTRDALSLERDRVFADLRQEVARLVVSTTGKVTGKFLTPEDQERLSQEATREIAA